MDLKYHYRICLDTLTDVRDFVSISERETCKVLLADGAGLVVNGKSIFGAIASLEWRELYLYSDEDVYHDFERFIPTTLMPADADTAQGGFEYAV